MTAKRPEVDFTPTHSRFLLQSTQKNYQIQYAPLYTQRLAILREEFRSRMDPAKKKRLIEKIINLNEDDEVVLVCGTLYKDQKLKPSVMDEFAIMNVEEYDPRERSVKELQNFSSPEDFLVLEDESGRVPLIGVSSEIVAQLTTGIVLVAKGKLLETGQFETSEFLFPGDPLSPISTSGADSLSSSSGSASANDEAMMTEGLDDDDDDENKDPRRSSSSSAAKYLLLVSNLNSGAAASRDPLSMHLLVDFVCGHLRGDEIGKRVCRVVVAGGSVACPSSSSSSSGTLPISSGTSLDAKLSSQAQEQLVDPIRHADRALAEMASCVPVDVMPGAGDPCSASLPQQPFYSCLFPHASRLSSFSTVSNPYSFTLDGGKTRVVGTSGQPVDNVLKYTRGMGALEAMQRCILQWRHLSPTSPDTLACFPFLDRDPFVVGCGGEELPSLFFSSAPKGGAFETVFAKNVRFVNVPDFTATGQVVVVDVTSPALDATVLTFSSF